MEDLEKIRNNVAHAQSILGYEWHELYRKLKSVEKAIENIDKFLEES